jgi:putative acetyltransferase
MTIRPADPTDRDALFDIWLRAVRATHTFVSEEDIHSFTPLVRDYLASGASEIWVLCTGGNATIGFMGMSAGEIESLFIDPEFHGQGGGRRLVEHAIQLRGELTVSVNEQNEGAVRSYEACGFIIESRSETDTSGRPYPLLNMRLTRA